MNRWRLRNYCGNSRQCLDFTAVQVTAEDHSHPIRLALAVNLIYSEIKYRLGSHIPNRPMQRHFADERPPQLFAFVAHVEIQLAIRAKDEGMNAMIVIDAGDADEKH